MNIINEFFVSFILIKLYFKFKVCRKIKFPLLWKFYFSKWKFYFSADMIIGVLFFFQKDSILKGLGNIFIGIGFFFLGVDYIKSGFENFKHIIDLSRFDFAGFKGVFVF